jgi:hydrogenase/urease accessory protein HupE
VSSGLRSWLAAALLALWVAPSPAHELQPGFLELRETTPGRFDVLWKLPSIGGSDVRMPILPVFPPQCRLVGEARSERVDTAWVFVARIDCDNGLAGQTLAIDGLSAFDTDVLVRVQHADANVETHLLKPASPSVTLRPAGAGAARGVFAYLSLGIEHILLGLDHLLFVLGLLLIVRDRWMLVKTVTAFTVAHSITLAVATFGIASVPALPLNAAIALSILFLGPEIVRRWRGETSFTIRHPWVVAFAFGLLHGFGFASGLAQLGLPRSEIPWALLLFNVGVEIGQLAFVVLILLMERAFRQLQFRWPLIVARLPGYFVGTMGAFWTIQRVLMLVRGVA